MSRKWLFHDPVGTLPDYTFLANPTGDSPQYAKNLDFQALTAPGTLPLLYEGQDTPTVWSVTGAILTQTQYQTFLSWWSLRHQFQVTDDLDRVRWIYLTTFSPVRKMSRLFPWRHDYTLAGYQFGAEAFPVATDPNIPWTAS